MEFFWKVVGIFYFLNIGCIILVVFVERKKPQATLAWVLAMVLCPLLGAVFYLFLGRAYTVGKKSFLFERLNLTDAFGNFVNQQLKASRAQRLQNMDLKASAFAEVIGLHLKESGSIYTQDNELYLFVTAKEKYQKLYADLQAAKQSIHMEYFIIRKDAVGQRIVDLLAQKAKEGIQVRLLYDEYGAKKTDMAFFRPIVKAGGKVCRFYGKKWMNFLNSNHRNHRKIVVIDGKVAYMGGMNLGIEYMGHHPKVTPWRDTHLRIEGSCVYFLQIRFLLDWCFSSKEQFDLKQKSLFTDLFPESRAKGQAGVQIVSSGPDATTEAIRDGYVKLINTARERIYIQTPYFIPDDLVRHCLKIAARSGVDVRLMLPGVPDKKFVYTMTLSYVEELLASGIRVYFYGGFIHSKTIVVDGIMASVGTTNFDIRSFDLNFEVNAFIYDGDFSQRCEEAFFTDIKKSREEIFENFIKRPWFKKWGERLCRLLSPIS
jgi:cardiolipin synthase